jgi:predicted nucleic acid-binding protein
VVVTRGWVIDKSAYARLLGSPEVDEWLARIERGLVRITTVTLLELGYSALTSKGWVDAVREPPVGYMPVEHLTPLMEARAVEVQGVLAERGQHRAPSVPDLLIAAAAELAGLVVLHVDKDFDLIAAITGQRVERLAATGWSAASGL